MKRLVMAALISLAPLAGSYSAAAAFQLFPHGLFGGHHETRPAAEQPTVHLAQAADPASVTQLQEEIRSLNGRIEEMSFQLLQMQEQLRKYQEDNEFRFQELEGGGVKKSGALDKPVDGGQTQSSVADAGSLPNSGDSGLGMPEQTLGSIELDANGMPVGTTLNEGSLQTENQEAAIDSSTLPGVDAGPEAHTASLSGGDDIYQAAYSHVLSGDYGVAEKEFTKFIGEYPDSKKIADAHFWLGEAQYSQGDFNAAAKTFLNAHQAYSMSPKAPEMLLKLGMSMAQLDNKDTACAIYTEVGKRYPQASRAITNKVASERKRLSC
ncbi:tol-pal system protein YbgF [Agrobacterium sp. ES01]|uniref:tol-pal system protein YbgF n=1 Tax=Agrobacterium sp. ES01 TaxID=3420714 RepID=UPI003D0BC5CE